MLKRFVTFIMVTTFISIISLTGATGTENTPPRDIDDENLNTAFTISFPTSLDFIIDPFELLGRGQIHSEEFIISNLGDNDAIITITDISVVFVNSTEFLPLSEPFNSSIREPLKAIYMVLDFGNANITPVVMTSPITQVISIYLGSVGSSTSTITLSISGSVNPEPVTGWNDGDVKISITYDVDIIDESTSGYESINPDDVIYPDYVEPNSDKSNSSNSDYQETEQEPVDDLSSDHVSDSDTNHDPTSDFDAKPDTTPDPDPETEQALQPE